MAPDLKLVRSLLARHLESDFAVSRVQKGTSTFVYRVSSRAATYYLRILPEDASFGAEVLAHKLLIEAGVHVPSIILYEERNEIVGRSIMLATEVQGKSIEDERPMHNIDAILRQAGRELARIHSIPVDGFSWIDRSYTSVLKGTKPSFSEYFNEHLDTDLEALKQYRFTQVEVKKFEDYMSAARHVLDVTSAVLVHGDFDISHILHLDGRYTGIIDFGEIRGNNPLYDLATFVGFYQDRDMYQKLLAGYIESRPLSDKELYSVELMALFMIVRFLGKSANTGSSEHWFGLGRQQLLQVERANAAYTNKE